MKVKGKYHDDATTYLELLIRLFHWSLAIAFLMNFAVLEQGEKARRWMGYYILSALVVRFIWGTWG